MRRFSLEPGQWYAVEFLSDSFFDTSWQPDNRSYSPIKVLDIKPHKDGQRRFTLDFYHSNYPAGVQGKRYKLQTLERGEHFILARCNEHDPVRLLYITEISYEWIDLHFPGHIEAACKRDGRNNPPDNIHEFLEQHA